MMTSRPSLGSQRIASNDVEQHRNALCDDAPAFRLALPTRAMCNQQIVHEY
jgi:hypothetical protein